MVHGLIKHFLKFHGVSTDGGMMWRKKTGLLDELLVAEDVERLEAGTFVVVHGLIVQLFLHVIEIILGDIEDIVDVDVRVVLLLIFRHDVDLLLTGPTERAKKHVEAKIHRLDPHSPRTLGPGSSALLRCTEPNGARMVH